MVAGGGKGGRASPRAPSPRLKKRRAGYGSCSRAIGSHRSVRSRRWSSPTRCSIARRKMGHSARSLDHRPRRSARCAVRRRVSGKSEEGRRAKGQRPAFLSPRAGGTAAKGQSYGERSCWAQGAYGSGGNARTPGHWPLRRPDHNTNAGWEATPSGRCASAVDCRYAYLRYPTREMFGCDGSISLGRRICGADGPTGYPRGWRDDDGAMEGRMRARARSRYGRGEDPSGTRQSCLGPLAPGLKAKRNEEAT